MHARTKFVPRTGDDAQDHNERRRYYETIAPLHLTPLWESLHALVPPEPRTPAVPAHWRYASVRPHLMQAGKLISAEEAVRRVLILENPALLGQSCVTQSLYAGLQLILPGEVAPSHRHTQSALRFVVEGDGAYTAVDGERATMRMGDFLITPSWTWHDHGNESNAPMVWLDGLDIPMLRFFDAGFAENDTSKSQSVTRVEGTSVARYGANMAPVTNHRVRTRTSPIFSYPYDRTREALARLARDAAIDAWDGVKLRYVNPTTGGWAMPTLGPWMQLLPHGFVGKAQRSTDGTVYSVVEGHGRARITRGDASWTFEFAPRDHFVVPSWHALALEADDEAVLFGFSDRPVHEALGIFRQERM